MMSRQTGRRLGLGGGPEGGPRGWGLLRDAARLCTHPALGGQGRSPPRAPAPTLVSPQVCPWGTHTPGHPRGWPGQAAFCLVPLC